MSNIEKPVAMAIIRWLSAAEGGRKAGPPLAKVYMATAFFLTDKEEVDRKQRDSPILATTLLSILIQKTSQINKDEDRALIGFLAPNLARPSLYKGAKILITEGPKIVANAVVKELLPSDYSQ